jgi:hypothetical protein
MNFIISVCTDPQVIFPSAKSVIVNEGGEVTFRCASSGVPAPVDYYWWFGDARLCISLVHSDALDAKANPLIQGTAGTSRFHPMKSL